MSARWVKVLNENILIDAYLAKPDGLSDLPAVIVVQEIFGVNEHIQDITRRLAGEGYVARSPLQSISVKHQGLASVTQMKRYRKAENTRFRLKLTNC